MANNSPHKPYIKAMPRVHTFVMTNSLVKNKKNWQTKNAFLN